MAKGAKGRNGSELVPHADAFESDQLMLYDIERKFYETRLYQVAPIGTNMILSYVAEHVLGLPRSY